MGSILAKIGHSSKASGIRAVLSGVEKIGKTTLACSAPKPLLIPLEQGYSGVSVECVPMLTDYESVMQLMEEIIYYAEKGQFPYRTLVFDSCTALERLIHDRVLQTDPAYAKGNLKALTMESALGGYGKAYQYANELFDNFLKKCDVLVDKFAVNIVLTCHVFVSRMVDPTAGEYDSFDLLLHSPKNQKTYGKREMITQWADLIGFLHEPILVSEGKVLNKAFSANQGRILGVSRTPGYVAGNRYGLIQELPIPSENGWNQIAHAIYTSKGLDFYNRG